MPTRVLALLSSRKSHRRHSTEPGRLRCKMLNFRPKCHTLLNALLTSWRTRLMRKPSDCVMAIVTEAVTMAWVVPLLRRKPYNLCPSRWSLSRQFMIRSRIFPGTSSSEMGRWLSGRVVAFPGFTIIISAFLRRSEKYPADTEGRLRVTCQLINF